MHPAPRHAPTEAARRSRPALWCRSRRRRWRPNHRPAAPGCRHRRRSARSSSRRPSAWPTCGLRPSSSAGDGRASWSAAARRCHSAARDEPRKQCAQTSLSLVVVGSILVAQAGSPGSSDVASLPSAVAQVDTRFSGLPHTSSHRDDSGDALRWRTYHRRMQRLSGLDASFLYLETPSQPLHVCSILELDTSTMPGGYTFDRLRDELALRIKAMPQFREKLADSPLNLDHPVWVDDNNFDVNRHLHRIGLPPPGGRNELAEICGHIAGLPLDRTRPLWEMWVIEGVAGTDAQQGGRLAVMTKVHHACVDGVTGANLMSQLCSTEADAPAPEPVEGVGGASHIEIAVSGAVKFAARPLRFANALTDTASSVVKTVLRARSGQTMAPPFAAPRTAFNASVTSAPQHRLRAAGPRGHQKGQELLRRQGQRRGDGTGVRRAAPIPARPWRTAGLVVGGDGAGVSARQVGSAWAQSGFGNVFQPAHAYRRPGGADQGHRRCEFGCQTT